MSLQDAGTGARDRESPSMPTSRSLRLAAASVAALACVVATSAEAAPKKKPGPNLLVNPGFEDSAFEGNPAVARGSLAQPVLPTGWSFEGLSVLFDHSPNVKRSGKRSAAISGSLSTPRTVCQNGVCQANPLNAVRDATAATYTLTPSWRTLNPVSVVAGTRYTLSAFVGWDIMTAGTEATTKVRWLGANGMAISESYAGKIKSTPQNSTLLRWTQISGVVTAPAGAVSAHVLLSHTDDAWVSQVRYDDVYFGTAP